MESAWWASTRRIFLGFAISAALAVPLGIVMGSFRFFQSLLEQNWSILVFPEGRLTVCGPMRPFKAGVGLMAVETGVPVLPVRVDIKKRGPWEGAGRLSRGEVEVRFGEPRRFEPDEDPSAATAWIEEAVRQL